jgi:tRNA(Ile)-lysidine synthase
MNPSAVENIARAAEILSEADESLDFAASAFLDEARVGSAEGIGKSKCGIEVLAYSVPELLKLPVGLRRRVIMEAIKRARIESKVKSSDRAQITSSQVASVEKLVKEQASGKHTKLPGRLEVWREFDAIVFRSTSSEQKLEQAAYLCEISSERARIEAGGLSIRFERGIKRDLYTELMGMAVEKKKQTGQDWTIVALDDERLPERLTVRPRRPGETALVAGKRRIIKLKNLMIDHKIPTSRRGIWPVVTTPDDRYVWSPGLPPAVEFAASDRTRKLAILRSSGF